VRPEKNGHPTDAVTRIPLLLNLFALGGQLTSNQLAVMLGIPSGEDPITLCRQAGLPLQMAGIANHYKLPTKMYALDGSALWRAWEEAIRQIDRYILILQSTDPSKSRRTFQTVGRWMQHVPAH
jgi:hypothetical protein